MADGKGRHELDYVLKPAMLPLVSPSPSRSRREVTGGTFVLALTALTLALAAYFGA